MWDDDKAARVVKDRKQPCKVCKEMCVCKMEALLNAS